MDVLAEMETYRTCSLDKLHYMYLTMSEHAYFNVDQMVEAKGTANRVNDQQVKT